jgi:hypothetical protein
MFSKVKLKWERGTPFLLAGGEGTMHKRAMKDRKVRKPVLC